MTYKSTLHTCLNDINDMSNKNPVYIQQPIILKVTNVFRKTFVATLNFLVFSSYFYFSNKLHGDEIFHTENTVL